MSRLKAVGIALCAVATLVAQSAGDEHSVRGVTPLDEGDLARRGVTVRAADGERGGSLLTWRGNQMPLHVPPERVALGAIDDDLLVVLAGGIRGSLDVYILEADGAIARLATAGGRRLPASFNGGGSWPVAVGRRVFVVAFEKDDRIELRAIGFGDRVFAARTLPGTATGFEVQVDASVHKIAVHPLGVAGAPPLEFVHPLAPRVEFVQPLLDLGPVRLGGEQRAVASLRNPTARPIEVALLADGVFGVQPAMLQLGAGATADVEVSFAPTSARGHRGRLLASHAGLDRPVVLALRGQGVGEALTEPASLTVPPPTQREPQAEPRAPAAEFADARAAVAKAAAPQPRPQPRPTEPRPPELTREGEFLLVRGQPGEVLLLALVSLERDEDALKPLRTLTAWRTRLDAAEGMVRLALRSLAPEAADLGLVALRRGGRGLVQSNILPADAPSGPR